MHDEYRDGYTSQFQHIKLNPTSTILHLLVEPYLFLGSQGLNHCMQRLLRRIMRVHGKHLDSE